MKASGLVLALAGIVVLLLGVVRHFTHSILAQTAHASLILGAVGAVLLIIGLISTQAGRQSALE